MNRDLQTELKDRGLGPFRLDRAAGTFPKLCSGERVLGLVNPEYGELIVAALDDLWKNGESEAHIETAHDLAEDLKAEQEDHAETRENLMVARKMLDDLKDALAAPKMPIKTRTVWIEKISALLDG